MPGSDWDVGVLARLNPIEQQRIGAPDLVGRAEIRAAAEAAAPGREADREEAEEEARELGVPDDPIGVDAYSIQMYRKCLGGPVKEGTVRSQLVFILADQMGCPM